MWLIFILSSSSIALLFQQKTAIPLSMCGIVGLIDFSAITSAQKAPKGIVTPELIAKMRDVMVHRGPDGAGEYVNTHHTAGFGHRRLSIIDLATSANQPMPDKSTGLTLVFNGEIYNHAELRTELTGLGVKNWQTSHSDTEVLLKAWQFWGEDCLPKLRGMFAFGVWDEAKGTLTLVRDRIGVKPLYFAETDGKISFASEIKALLQTPWQIRSVNENGLFHYLSFLTVPAPETLFDGIYKLPAGSMVTFGNDNHGEIKEWWNALSAAENEAFTPDPETAVLERLQDAVADRKVADVEVGVLLSGGVDSSTNVALFSEMGNTPVKTFCIGYDSDYDSAPNEFAPAAEVAQKFNTTHFERHLTMPEVLNFLPEMVWLQDEPIADPVCVPVYFVSEEARKQGVTVAQVGEGADELFFGYRNWRAKWWLQKLANITPAFTWRWAENISIRLGKDHTRLHDVFARAANKQPIFCGGVDIFTEAEKQRLLGNKLKQKFAGHTSWDIIQPYYKSYRQHAIANTAKTAGWMTWVDLRLRLPELLLMRLDKMCMGVSLEGRVPFLDHRLVSLALSLPERARMHPKKLKPLLKNIASNFLPQHIVHRRKQGFALPVHEWFFTELGTEARTTINHFITATDLLDSNAVEVIFARQDHQKAWYILNLALWWAQYIEPKTAPTTAIKNI